MKRLVLSLALAATACLPIAVSAQQTAPATPTAAQRQQMRADFEQIRKLHEQYRTQVLGALSPAHRQLLAQVVGNLAVADHPDYRGAVSQLDAALSSGEKSAILSADQQMRAQMKSIFANMPKPQWVGRAGGPAGGPPRPRHSGKPHQRTAGGILLGLASGHGMMMGPRGGFRGGPPPHH